MLLLWMLLFLLCCCVLSMDTKKGACVVVVDVFVNVDTKKGGLYGANYQFNQTTCTVQTCSTPMSTLNVGKHQQRE